MNDLTKTVKQIADAFHIDTNHIQIYPHETGVWENTLYEVIALNQHLLYKQFHPFGVINITYTPPNTMNF